MTDADKSPKSKRTRRINRSQQKAIEVRSAATKTPAVKETEPGEGVKTKSSTRRKPRGRRIEELISRPVALSREQEYAFIRSDLRRLAYTAVPLLLLMFGLLFFVD